MKKLAGIILCGLLSGLFVATAGIAKDMSRHAVIERIQALEENTLGRFSLGGLIEAEGDFQSTDVGNTGDIVLATAALGVDVDIAENVTCDFLFLYEDNDPEHIEEGFITVDGGDTLPLSLRVGKMYVPFGNFESHFISFPMTMEIGETNQSAASVVFASDMIEITGSVFNGDVDETGEDDAIGSFALSAVFTVPSDVAKDVELTGGVSMISNIGDTDGLEGETPGVLSSHVAGFSAFVNLIFLNKYFLEVEYLGAMDEFEAGELSFDGGETFAPRAWNLELAMAVTERLEVAAKYEVGRDLGDFFPENRFGVAATWALFENTDLAAEYLRGEFAGGGDVDGVKAQVAVAF